MERSYFTKEAAELLGVQPVTIRSWALLFEDAGYKFARDPRGSRAFVERDIAMFRHYIELTQTMGIPQHLAIQTAMDRARGGTPESTDVVASQPTQSTPTPNAMGALSTQRYETLVDEFRGTVDAVLQSNRVLLQHIDAQRQLIERMDHRNAQLVELLTAKRQIAATRSSTKSDANDGFWDRVHGMFRR